MMPWEVISECARAVQAVCGVMTSPAGQAILAQWAKDGDRMRSDWAAAGAWVKSWLLKVGK